MSRSGRMFEIIQMLRSAAAPLTARAIAEALEVAQRTIYRDIAALQAMRVPVEGEAGIGYVMRAGFDLPPLMFSAEEVEAIVVGLSLLGRTGDAGLQAAAARAGGKIAAVLPAGGGFGDTPLYVSHWNAVPAARVDLRRLRQAIREEGKLCLAYEDAAARRTERLVKPLALIYYVDVVVLAAWCELRDDFRHFRIDRITACRRCEETFKSEGAALRARWRALHELPSP